MKFIDFFPQYNLAGRNLEIPEQLVLDILFFDFWDPILIQGLTLHIKFAHKKKKRQPQVGLSEVSFRETHNVDTHAGDNFKEQMPGRVMEREPLQGTPRFQRREQRARWSVIAWGTHGCTAWDRETHFPPMQPNQKGPITS